ncbi:phage holin family protein [Kribbella deserti]|uniref:Phage holin family protein n=1 Tax=Kribbella deserti TaxID=1926257 RepID=A0ABV6QJ53_9ACTN
MSQQPAGSNDGEPTIGQLVADASRDLSALVRSELQLAQTELKATAVAAGTGVGMFGGAAFLGLLAIVLLSIAAGYGLVAIGLHPALAFLIVAVVYLLIAAALVFIGKNQLGKAQGPKRAIETSKQSVEVLKAVGKGD